MSIIVTYMKLTAYKKTSGFTLVELLIVIAVIGVLAAVILVVINPLQQLARSRDAGRTSSVSQLGNAAQRMFTATGAYPTVPGSGAGTFMTQLQTAGEIQNTLTNPNYAVAPTSCTGVNLQNNFCYNSSATQAIVYAPAEATANTSLCAAGNGVWIVWSSAAGRTGIVCTTNASTLPALGVATFAN